MKLKSPAGAARAAPKIVVDNKAGTEINAPPAFAASNTKAPAGIGASKID